MVYISEVEHLFPFVEPTHQIYDRMFMLQDCLPTVARQLSEATTDMSVHGALIDAIYKLRDCATAVAHAMSALSDFTRAISSFFEDVESELDLQIVEIAKHYEAFLDCLENVLNLTSRCDDALVKAEAVMVHALSYHPSIVDYVLVKYLFPFIARHWIIDLSPRAIMLTAGRSTLGDVRLTVFEIADLMRLLRTYASESRAHFRLDVLVGIRAQPKDTRTALSSALDAVTRDLRGGVHAMESAEQRIGYGILLLGPD
ncbi:uncharacterized protein SCHCODRAFT_02546260 [Schizophyllum commune H4-8]|nr:uncharacterized protein SCHCODRAFT_02546260 [Schizophyllum commune H4-8]KAI5890101.1 hypothetical protein SCHCODRAFT_02546260 [Schizophyllum commune H4-8]